jgi:type I restriction enzyme M protein
MRSSESRAEAVASELLTIRGWKVAKPPKGNVLWKNEYRDYPRLLDALTGKGKQGKGGDAYPDFLVVNPETLQPLIVGETKASETQIDLAMSEASNLYGEALAAHGLHVLAAGIAGDDKSNIEVRIKKRSGLAHEWKVIQYRANPIQWLPTPHETHLLLDDDLLFDLQPRIPSNEILAKRGEDLNRTLRECTIKDEFRPAIIGAFMLALWYSKGQIRMDAEYVLSDINAECRKAFIRAGKGELATSIQLPEANKKLAARAPYICHILRLLNITTLTAEHDYLGQLYEAFFRFTGGNTIGQFFTPRHITRFMAELCDVSKADLVIDPTCGTGGFLISALHRMMERRHFTYEELTGLVKDHLIGFESEPITAALCVANMILRGDGTTGIIKGDCFTHPDYPEGRASIALGNPPFPHKKTDDPPEKFVDRGLEALTTRGKLAMIVPGSILVKSNKKRWRARTLRDHSLRAVMTLPAELFQPYASSTTAILLLEKGVPHEDDTRTLFSIIENDGFKLKKNVRVEQPGEQLTPTLSAYRGATNVPGVASWGFLQGFEEGEEWAPGKYVTATVSETERDPLETEINWLIRSQAAFHARFAPELQQFRELLDSGALKPLPYALLAARKPRLPTIANNRVGGLFDVYYGQRSLHSKEHLQPGASLIISSAGTDNGCYGFFNFTSLIQPPFVTVPSTGSIGEAFVQTWPAGVTDDCLLLIPKAGTDIEDLYVTAATLRLERWRFHYGRKITPARIADVEVRRDDEFKDRIRSQRITTDGVIQDSLRLLADNGGDTLRSKVKELAEFWRQETAHLSSIEKKVMHPAYQSIIAMGKPAVPFVLEELRDNRGHWFWALHFMTGVDPTTEGDNVERSRAAWLEWGRQNGCLPSDEQM